MRVKYGKKGRTPNRFVQENKSTHTAARQLRQLLCCLVLFFAVFFGRGVFPAQMARVGPQLLGVIRANTDFRAAFASLGSVLDREEPLLDGLGRFCMAVFGVQGEDGAQSAQGDPVQVMQPESVEIAEQTAPEPVLDPGDVVETVANTGTPLPESYTYDKLHLGLRETADPVKGALTSAFGYRDHPTIGRHAVHGGVDIGAPEGTAVCAFSGGTVSYVGESDDFGLYLRLEHENGVSTFYSHCQSIAVSKGEQVMAGQQIAKVGSTGNSTGPHLHFEVQFGQTRLDPMHYITAGEG